MMSSVGPGCFPRMVVDGQFLPGFRKVRLRLGFRERMALFGRQIMEPEAENKEYRDG